MNHYMRAAYELAKAVNPLNVRPNPLVGAVIVCENGNIIGRGAHQNYGKAHAEVNAIEDALKTKSDLSNCVLYVTLEPCSHQGKTPPCTDLIIEKKIRQVVIGSRDPNPKVNGIDILINAGIEVVIDEYPEIIALNKIFFTNQKFNRPYLVLKMAMTLDGKIADRDGSSKWISNELSRAYVHEELRSNADSILSTAATIIQDNPFFNVRKQHGEVFEKDLILVDRNFQLLEEEYADLNIFKQRINSHVHIYGNVQYKKGTSNNVKVHSINYDAVGNIVLNDFFADLYNKGNYSILVEGGSKLATSLVMNGFYDEIYMFIAPMVIGDSKAIPVFQTNEYLKLNESKKLILEEIKQFDSDIMLRYK